MFGLVAVLATLGFFVARQLGDVGESLEQGYGEISRWVDSRFDVTLPSPEEIGEGVRSWTGTIDVSAAITTTVEVISAILLGVIALFFYLRDGPRFARVATGLTPERHRVHVVEVAGRVWESLGGYFRGQLLVAAVDAVAIGVGLALLGVPLAAPLALLVFFGGLFPIAGAFTAGLIAVLVALAEGGLWLAVAVAVLNLAVQQLEGNLLEPVIVGRATRLHPLIVLTSLAAGAVSFGLLGAFLAVPVAAALARVVGYATDQRAPSSG